jgi:hypothetical protein
MEKSSLGIFLRPTLWTLASAMPPRQSAEAINAAHNFIATSS